MVVKRTIALVLSSATSSAAAATALQLADQLLTRGHRVTIFSHGAAVNLALAGSPIAAAVAALLRRGVHGGTLDWVVESAALDGRNLIDGIIAGDDADLWSFVRDADVVLAPGGGHPWRVVS
jgi:sulfur relay (sulfurtransferase) complex TusBCD TusD component (DsrE family)